MELSMLHYYFLKSLEKEIPNQIMNKIDIDKTFTYAASNFIDLGYYYKILHIWKKDKYNLSTKLHKDELFFPYIYDNMLNAKYKNDYRHLYFIYGNIASYYLDKYVIPYLKAHETKKNSFYKLTNMIDCYYAYKNDAIDLSKTKLTTLFDYNMLYSEEIHNFVNKPIQKNLKFFACKNYYLHSLAIKMTIDNHFTKFNYYYFITYIMDAMKFGKDKKKLRHFRYKSKMDTSILNLSNQEFQMDNYSSFDSIDDVILKAYNESKTFIKAINNYIFFGVTKDFKKLTGLNIIEDKENEDKNNQDIIKENIEE